MSGAVLRRLGDVCQVEWGNTELTKRAYVEDGEFLAVSAAGIDGRINHFEHEPFVPVLSAIGSVGNVHMPRERFTAIKNTITLTPQEDLLDNWYLYYLLVASNLPKRGSVQSFMTKGDIKNFEVYIPPLAEQKRIVARLDAINVEVNRLEELLRRQLEVASDLRRSSLEAAIRHEL